MTTTMRQPVSTEIATAEWFRVIIDNINRIAEATGVDLTDLPEPRFMSYFDPEE